MFAFTEIDEFEITNETCFICGQPATTKEHLFPKWLQHRFNLWNQRLQIPNNTTISYRQLVVPCCTKCNNEAFATLEAKLSSNTETTADVWRWANKIHFGLTLKDRFLDWDRKNPRYKIGDVISPSDPLEQSRHFLHCVTGLFQTDPDPFGSVFKFTFREPQDYNFMHIINSSSIYICLGDRGYIVFIRDGNYLQNLATVKEDVKQLQSKATLAEVDMRFFYAKLLEYSERIQITFPVIVMPGKIVRAGGITIRKENPVNKDLLRAICNRFGITWIDNGAV